MKKEKDIRVTLLGEEGDSTPYIEVDYVDKYAQEHRGLMLLDSGSSDNFLSPAMGDSIGELCHLKDVTENIQTATGEVVTTNKVHFSFAVGGCQYSETFCINDNQLAWIKGIKIIGILGNSFFQKHRLVIDYSDFTLHTSHVSPFNLSIADCDFFFPMEIGLINYGVPVLCMKQSNQEIAALVDTGSDSNVLSESAIKDGFVCKPLGTEDTISGLVGQMTAKDAIMNFDLLRLKANGDQEIHHKENVKIIPINIIDSADDQSDQEGRPLEPVQAAIGASFIAKEGWVLDFGAKIIYKLKHVSVWNDNISVCVEVEKDNSEKERKTGRIPFFSDATKIGMPLIRISEGQLKGAIMMIDTGSNSNVLFGTAYNQLRDNFESVEGDVSIFGIDGHSVKADTVSGTVSFCGKQHEMTFLVRKDSDAFEGLYQNLGLPISGIIGTNFMVEHNWMIDFSKQEIVIPQVDISITDLQTIFSKDKERKVCALV